MRNIILLVILLAVLVGAAYYSLDGTELFSFVTPQKSAVINTNTITLEIADSPEEHQKGLSERSSLAENRGMLFVFEKADRHQFWMKNMRFPIDIIFLDDNKVVTVYRDVQPTVQDGAAKTENLTIYSPAAPVNRVLELNAGQAKKLNLNEGDTITLNL